MDLNSIVLPASLLTSFYKEQLVEEVLQPAPGPGKKHLPVAAELPYLGKNHQGVCILVNYPNDVYLPDEQLSFLTSILQACRLNLGDVAILNCHQHDITFQRLQEVLSCKYLLSFGVAPSRLGIDKQEMFTITSVNGCNMVFSPPTDQLNNKNQESKHLKAKLWGCLKELFAI